MRQGFERYEVLWSGLLQCGKALGSLAAALTPQTACLQEIRPGEALFISFEVDVPSVDKRTGIIWIQIDRSGEIFKGMSYCPFR